jgi:hypothetical protein
MKAYFSALFFLTLLAFVPSCKQNSCDWIKNPARKVPCKVVITQYRGGYCHTVTLTNSVSLRLIASTSSQTPADFQFDHGYYCTVAIYISDSEMFVADGEAKSSHLSISCPEDRSNPMTFIYIPSSINDGGSLKTALESLAKN